MHWWQHLDLRRVLDSWLHHYDQIAHEQEYDSTVAKLAIFLWLLYPFYQNEPPIQWQSCPCFLHKISQSDIAVLSESKLWGLCPLRFSSIGMTTKHIINATEIETLEPKYCNQAQDHRKKSCEDIQCWTINLLETILHQDLECCAEACIQVSLPVWTTSDNHSLPFHLLWPSVLRSECHWNKTENNWKYKANLCWLLPKSEFPN